MTSIQSDQSITVQSIFTGNILTLSLHKLNHLIFILAQVQITQVTYPINKNDKILLKIVSQIKIITTLTYSWFMLFRCILWHILTIFQQWKMYALLWPSKLKTWYKYRSRLTSVSVINQAQIHSKHLTMCIRWNQQLTAKKLKQLDRLCIRAKLTYGI